MPRHTACTLRVLSLSALAIAVPSGDVATAASQTFATSGIHPFTVPSGVSSLAIEAVGGRGGDLGGYGARVRGSVAVTPGESLSIVVAGNGGVGQAGAGGGGAVPLGSLAGGGGGASQVSRSGAAILVAGGGGGHGGDSSPGQGGAGGDAGDAGGDGFSLDFYMVSSGGGGGPGESSAAGSPGSAGASLTPGCGASAPGAPGASDAAAGQGGTGGASADPFGFGDGGGGGGGLYGGGGGGSGGYCAPDDAGMGGGGGGGGSSLVPAGGTLVIDSTGVPAVTLTWTSAPARRGVISQVPRISIFAPRDGATYAQNQVARASYRCIPRIVSITACSGPVPSGSPIDTSTLGTHTFTVAATTADGLRTERTSSYTVVDRSRPQIWALALRPSAIDLEAPRAGTTVTFWLSEDAQALVVVERLGRRTRARASRAVRVLRLAGRPGRNQFRLRARVGRRTLRPGVYRLTLVATDASANRSSPAARRFSVVG